MFEENKDPAKDPKTSRPTYDSFEILTIEKTVGRRKCPKCGNENKFMIHESIDKSTIINDYPRIYCKKWKCGECGVQWREK